MQPKLANANLAFSSFVLLQIPSCPSLRFRSMSGLGDDLRNISASNPETFTILLFTFSILVDSIPSMKARDLAWKYAQYIFISSPDCIKNPVVGGRNLSFSGIGAYSSIIE